MESGKNITEICGTVVLDELSGRMEYLHQFVGEGSKGLYERSTKIWIV
jgi:hypothetical protein